MRRIIFGSIVIILVACQQQKDQSKFSGNIEWIDLTYSFDSNTLYWPNNTKPFLHTIEAEGITDKGFYYSSYSICTPEHGGTHLDAPIHFSEGKYTVDQIPLRSLTGYAVVIDVSSSALSDRDYLINEKDVLNWEKENDRIEDSMIIIFRTGYGKYYPDREKYFGSSKLGVEALRELHFPGIDPDLATWLIKERKVKAVGLDTPSLDNGQSQDFRAHQVLMGANVPGFENLANLNSLPATGIYIVALPMKISKGSGGPLRIIAAVTGT